MVPPSDGKGTPVPGRNEIPASINGVMRGNAAMFGAVASVAQSGQTIDQSHHPPQKANETPGQHQPGASQNTAINGAGFQTPINGHDVNSIAANQMYMNSNNATAQAFAAAALAAQQIVQAQMGMSSPAQQAQAPAVPNNNPAVQNSNIGFNQAGMTGNMIPNPNSEQKINNIGAPIAAPMNAMNLAVQNGNQAVQNAQHFQQQTPIAVQAQAQAAAILAASSLGPNNIFNQAQSASVAAQAFALMLQQQQQAQKQAQGQMPKQEQLGSSTILHAPAPSNIQQVTQIPQQLQLTQQIQQATQEMVDMSQQKANTDLSTLTNSPPSSNTSTPPPAPQQQVIQNSKLPPQKRMKLQNLKPQEKALPKSQQSAGLPPAHHVKYSPPPQAASAMRQPQQQVQPAPTFQLSVTTPTISGPIAPVHHNSIASSQHGHNNLFHAGMNPIVLSQMQSWKLNQLESHVQLLNETNQPVPQPVQMLLAEARRLEEKRAAKRIANRKSACTSRARKKALVAEMTKTNARLRRQAIILSLLPDLVIAITDDGTITFCSAQVERVLHHKLDVLVGSNIADLLTPSSRSAINGLIGKLVAAEKVALEDGNNKEGDESGRSSNSGNTGNSQAAIVSEQSDNFPLSIVKVESHKQSRANESSDSSGTGNNTNADVTMSQLAPSSLTNQSNSDGSVSNNSGNRKGATNSDVDSSSSSDAKNLSEANEALNRNVRFHNEQLKIKKESKKKCLAHKDDVTGDSVTANNADARLSSLMKQRGEEDQSGTEAQRKEPPNIENLEVSSSSSSTDSLLAGVEDRHKKRKRSDNKNSDDSGYRESGESDPSREDTASSTSDASNGGRPRPLAPTCNICLIRDNLTTIWCEVTSSIRSRSIDEEQLETPVQTSGSQNGKKLKIASSNSSDEQQSANDNPQKAQVKELLLCLRPIRDGVEKVTEDLRFGSRQKQRNLVPRRDKADKIAPAPHVETTPTSTNPGVSVSKNQDDATNDRRPMKKRPLDGDTQISGAAGVPLKKQTAERQDNAAEKSVVESLILMSSN